MLRGSFINGLYTFIGFFNKVPPEAAGTLLPIPGAAPRRPEPYNDII
jgi:hypothetical protein